MNHAAIAAQTARIAAHASNATLLWSPPGGSRPVELPALIAKGPDPQTPFLSDTGSAQSVTLSIALELLQKTIGASTLRQGSILTTADGRRFRIETLPTDPTAPLQSYIAAPAPLAA